MTNRERANEILDAIDKLSGPLQAAAIASALDQAEQRGRDAERERLKEFIANYRMEQWNLYEKLGLGMETPQVISSTCCDLVSRIDEDAEKQPAT